MMLGMVFLWAALIALSVWAVGALFPGRRPRFREPSERQPGAREILDTRYARGDLTREEYERMRRDVESQEDLDPWDERS